MSEYTIPTELQSNILLMIRYNVMGGKMIRGLFSVYSTYYLCDEWNEKIKEQYE